VAIHPLGPDGDDSGSECWSELAGVDQSRSILRLIDGLLASRGIGRQDLGAIACDAGPGAFTALRISCAVAQGCALGLGLPLVPVGTLEALALQVARSEGPGRHRILIATDARMNEVYAAVLDVELDAGLHCRSIQTARPPFVGRPQSLIDGLSGESEKGGALLLGGDGLLAYPEILTNMIEQGWRTRVAAEPARVLAADAVATLAQRRLADGGDFDPALAIPFYVRDKVALDLAEQQALRATRAQAA
jgi:tRNA threonylcarbamoyladenosine biosynthesis protein TsaB